MSELVMVPVPAERVIDVYRFLGSGIPGEAPEESRSSEWTSDEIRRCYTESPPAIKNVLVFLAGKTGQWVSSTDIGHYGGYSTRQLAGAMGAFQRRLQNRYKKSDPPFDRRWDANAIGMVYKMDDDVAAVVTEAANR